MLALTSFVALLNYVIHCIISVILTEQSLSVSETSLYASSSLLDVDLASCCIHDASLPSLLP
jgi:hypothetical protein